MKTTILWISHEKQGYIRQIPKGMGEDILIHYEHYYYIDYKTYFITEIYYFLFVFFINALSYIIMLIVNNRNLIFKIN